MVVRGVYSGGQERGMWRWVKVCCDSEGVCGGVERYVVIVRGYVVVGRGM